MSNKSTADKAVTDANVKTVRDHGNTKQVDVTVPDEGTGHDAINEALPKKKVKQNVSVDDAQQAATSIEENSTQSDQFEYAEPLGNEVWKLIKDKGKYEKRVNDGQLIIIRK